MASNALRLRARRCGRALALATALAGGVAAASAPSLEECFEGSDFIANAARARDNGLPRASFLDRLDADFEAIRAFPPDLRWFVHDRDDESFLRDAAASVFDRPAAPEDHRSEFLRACFARLRV
jgi:hypothetical protein